MGPGPEATKPETADGSKSVSWFSEANLSFTANKNLKTLNSHGEFVTATYRQNNLYYDCILDGMDKEASERIVDGRALRVSTARSPGVYRKS